MNTAVKKDYEFLEPVPQLDDCEDDPVGVIEIAERLSVLDRSVHMMRRRHRLPAPDFDQVNGSRAWNWRTVLWWAGESGRMYNLGLVKQYQEAFGLNPPTVTDDEVAHSDMTFEHYWAAYEVARKKAAAEAAARRAAAARVAAKKAAAEAAAKKAAAKVARAEKRAAKKAAAEADVQ